MARATKASKTAAKAETEPQTAGNLQDAAEAVNLQTATEKKEEIDTVTTTSDVEETPKAKKEPKTKKEPKAKKIESDEEETPKAKKEPKAKKVESDEEEAKPKKQTKTKKPAATESDEDEPKGKKEPKEKKRAPSAYNIFVKEVMPQLKKENEALGDEKKSQRDLMKLAAELWNKKKAEIAATA